MELVKVHDTVLTTDGIKWRSYFDNQKLLEQYLPIRQQISDTP
jgi:hypothetical protein